MQMGSQNGSKMEFWNGDKGFVNFPMNGYYYRETAIYLQADHAILGIKLIWRLCSEFKN